MAEETTESNAAEAGTQSAAPAASAARGDYDARLASDHTFAQSEAKSNQSRADRAEASNRSLTESLGGENSSLQALLSQGVTAQTIAAAVQNYAAARNDEKLGKAILQYEQTGQFSTSGNGADPSDDNDEYLTPEQREIRELKAQLGKQGTQLNGLTQNTGTAALQGHLEKFAADYMLKPEEFEAVKNAMKPQIQTWGTSDAGRQVLQNLQTPTGYTTVKALALQHVPESVIFDLGERKRLRERQGVERFRTDGPAEASTTGTEPPPEVKTALQALEYSRLHPDRI